MTTAFRNIVSTNWRVSHVLITLIIAAYLLVMYNGTFFTKLNELQHLKGLENTLFLSSVAALLLAMFYFFLTLVTVPYIAKFGFTLILLSAPAAYYFMDAYHIVLDRTMLENVMQTDVKEASELFNSHFALYYFISGIIPTILLWQTKILYGTPLRFIIDKLLTILISISITAVIVVTLYQDLASLSRNNRHIRDYIIPVNYIYSLQTYLKQFLPKNIPEFKHIALDSHQGIAWDNASDRKVITVIVVGETARAMNFSLFGYHRKTNPELEKEQLISFSDATSCGTATATSLPCMFSNFDREHYSKNRVSNSENLLDVIKRAGVNVIWMDNNSGCKGVCERITNLRPDPESNPDDCQNGNCYDLALEKDLEKIIGNVTTNSLVVLHQAGSHGPAYYLRVPPEFQKFEPFCQTNRLQECSRQEIINAYDNTILYTDYVIAKIIALLKSKQDKFDVSLIYMSDHGESLGENNLFLHGLPYSIAPVEQTHVPLLIWMGESFQRKFSINNNCLTEKSNQPVSHDNFFDSLLGMLNIETTAYRPDHDLFFDCHSNPETPVISTFHPKLTEKM